MQFIFLLVIGTITILFNIIISRYHISTKYIIYVIEGNNRKRLTSIRGNFIDISYDEERVRIYKADGIWYCQRGDNKNEALDYNKSFFIGSKEFALSQEEKQGGFWVSIPLIISALTVIILFYQGYRSMNYIDNNKNDNSVSKTTEESDYLSSSEDIVEQTASDDRSESLSIDVTEEADFQYNHVVDWTSYRDDGKSRRSLVNCPSEMGLNATKYQGNIDWEKVKSDGIDFALIHIGSRGYETGKLRLDEMFEKNIKGAIANGIKVGTTFYSQAITKEEIDEEVDLMIHAVKDYELEYPIGISLNRDMGCRARELSDEQYVELLKYFCIRVEQAGYTPMIMGREEWYYQFEKSTFAGYLKLVASEKAPSSDIDNCIIWGYEENSIGVVNGINDNLNVSIYLSGYVDKKSRN